MQPNETMIFEPRSSQLVKSNTASEYVQNFNKVLRDYLPAPVQNIENKHQNSKLQQSSIKEKIKSPLEEQDDQDKDTVSIKSKKSDKKASAQNKKFFKSNFKFLDQKVQNQAQDILSNRKKLKNLTIIQQKYMRKDNSKPFSIDNVIHRVNCCKKKITEGRGLIYSLEKNLKNIEKELLIMKTQD